MTNQTIFNLFSAMREGKVITVRGLLSSSGDEKRWGDAIALRSAMELVASVYAGSMFSGNSRFFIDDVEVDLTNETTMDNPSTSGHVAQTPSANTGEI